jgi:hypothetical protein
LKNIYIATINAKATTIIINNTIGSIPIILPELSPVELLVLVGVLDE